MKAAESSCSGWAEVERLEKEIRKEAWRTAECQKEIGRLRGEIRRLSDFIEKASEFKELLETRIKKESHCYSCPECAEAFYLANDAPSSSKCNYCPQCGARLLPPEENQGVTG